jgi:hypothetical protein
LRRRATSRFPPRRAPSRKHSGRVAWHGASGLLEAVTRLSHTPMETPTVRCAGTAPWSARAGVEAGLAPLPGCRTSPAPLPGGRRPHHPRRPPYTLWQPCGLLPLLVWGRGPGVSTSSVGLHPERMRSLSPGLRGTSYPGCATGGRVNPERVVSFVPLTAGNPPHSVRCRRVIQPLQGWRFPSVRSPRVARASRLRSALRRGTAQPWVERCNPFGIAASSVGRMSKARMGISLVPNTPAGLGRSVAA